MNKELLNRKVKEINSIMEGFLPAPSFFDKKIVDAMHHSVTAGGKRIRPMLMREAFYLLSEEGADETSLHAFMAAMEFIHSYSLVHDDLPCMDDAEFRRGRLATHVKFGEAFGVLAGDALLNTAFEIVAGRMNHLYDAQELSRCARAFYLLASSAGVHGMIGGQAMDVQTEQSEDGAEELAGDASGELLAYIYDNKTAALIKASLMIGAILAGGTDSDIAVMERIGRSVGLAFQIKDDILDKVSDTQTLGKDAGSDEKNNKFTYVDLVGLEQAKEEVRQASSSALSDLASFEGRKNEFLEELIRLLAEREF